jgi:chromosome transmission fidelity protein 4
MGTGEWDLALPKGEEATGVAIGDNWAAVATSLQMIRLFRPSGLQDIPAMLPGPLVTMVGHGNLLGVIYHKGVTFGNNQQALGYSVFRVQSSENGPVLSSFNNISNGTLPLGQEATLRWAGFSELGMFCISDSGGLLLGLEDKNELWVPLKRLHSAGAQSQYWMIGVIAEKAMAVMVQGDHPEPRVSNPKPIITSLDLRPPLIRADEDETLWKMQMQVTHEPAASLQTSQLPHVTPSCIAGSLSIHSVYFLRLLLPFILLLVVELTTRASSAE